jgi:hypothetical protein
MKKAKVILSAIAVFALIGGAFAVKATKATKYGAGLYYSRAGTTTISGITYPYCSFADYTLSTTGGVTLTLYKSTLPGNVCTTSFYTTHAISVPI